MGDEDPTDRARPTAREHPSDSELAAYARGATAVGSDLWEHLAECSRCRAFLARGVIGAQPDAGDLVGGRYLIEHLLATGGIGAVVRAQDTRLDRHVAIKLMLPHAAGDPKQRKRFELEAQLAVKMRSEHVARVLDVGDQSAQPYIVYEYLVGEDLAMVSRRGPVPIDRACEYVLQACEAIAEAHSLGIIHRDLKPANLFVTTRPDGSTSIKVIDFGIAKTTTFGRDGTLLVAPENPLLTHDKIVGTPRYMSPEQIKASTVDARTDVWGMGMVLYELLTTKCPFEADTVEEIFAKILHQPPESTTIISPDIPRALDRVIMRCLARDPNRRFGTIAELARALVPFAPPEAAVSADRAERVISGELAGPSGTGQVPRIASPRRRWFAKKWPIIAGAVALVALPIALALALRGGGGTSVAIGAPCTDDGACGDLACNGGVCTRSCARATDCPAPSTCTSDGTCNIQLRVGFVYVGVPEDQGWTHAHDLGRRAAAKLPYVETDYIPNAYRPADAERAVDELVGRGFNVIVANSSSLGPTLVPKARQYPDVRFIAVMSHSPGPGVGAINARMYEGWYVAGYAAAQKSKTHRLGYVAGLDTPEVVRDINAFTRGARAFRPETVVEVRWLGFWFDAVKPDAQGRYKEDRLTQELLDTGCDVIANHADNERVVAAVERAKTDPGGAKRRPPDNDPGARGSDAPSSGRPNHDAVSIANNSIDACGHGPTTCLGVPYWNWGQLYVEQLVAIHRGSWRADAVRWEPLRANPEASAVGFKLNAPVAGNAIALETASVVAELGKPDGWKRVFEGPYCSTGQREACVAEREAIDDDELRKMCWFVEGVIEKTDGEDRPALVPAGCMKR